MTRNKKRWEERIPYVNLLLSCESVKIQAKALWLLGKMGLAFPLSIQEHVVAVAAFLDSGEQLLCERAINALGRIGRGVFRR